MSFRIGIDIIRKARVDAWVQRFPKQVHRILRDDERGGDLDDARLFASKEAVVKAVSGLSLFNAHCWATTRVRGGYAAIPRAQQFEARLVAQRISWVSVACGEAHGSVWALAVAIPRKIPDFEVSINIRALASQLAAEEKLNSDSLAALQDKAQPEISRAARLAAINAAEELLHTQLSEVGIISRDDDSLAFNHPALLEHMPLSIAHEGNFVIGAVARAAKNRSVHVDSGSAIPPLDIS